jgi:hypothetical protein
LTITIAALTVALSGCGGGGGGGGGGGAVAGNAPAPAQAVGSGVGAITGFGSIFIDGKRLSTGSTTFRKSDEPAIQDDLRVGMVVKVRGDIDNGSVQFVEYDEDVKGPVDANNGTEIIVMGQTVNITPSTRVDNSLNLATLVAGDLVEVSGERGPNDEIEASFIEGKDPSINRFVVIGTVRDLDPGAQTFRVGNLIVDYSVAVLDDDLGTLANGMVVEVKDDNKAYNPGDFTLIATEVDAETFNGVNDIPGASDDNRTGGFVEVEGLITEVIDANTFVVRGLTVEVTNTTRFEFGDASLLVPGAKVEVEGRFIDEDTVEAAKIQFKRNAARLAGIVEDVDGTTNGLTVFGIPAKMAAPITLPSVQIGDFVEMRGIEADDMLIVHEIEVDDPDDTRARSVVDEVDRGAGQIVIFGVRISTDANTEYEGLNDQRLTADQFFNALTSGQTLVDAKWEDSVTDPAVPARELSLED